MWEPSPRSNCSAIFAVGVIATMGLIFWDFQTEGTQSQPQTMMAPIKPPLKEIWPKIKNTTYFSSEERMLADVAKLSPVHDIGCKGDCNAAKGWGRCDVNLNRCICSLGYGDTDCSLSREVLYLDQDIYAGLVLREVDTSGWDLGGMLYESLVAAIKPNLVIEVGVWKGSSACKFARGLLKQDGGLLIGVDTWLPVKYFWKDHNAENRLNDLHIVNGWPTIFYTFLGNVQQLGLDQAVLPFPATSRTAADFLFDRDTQAELIHVDAAHEYIDVQEDLNLWWRLLRPGGVMLGDDWSVQWPGVMQAVSEHAQAHGLSIKQYENKWWVQKPL